MVELWSQRGQKEMKDGEWQIDDTYMAVYSMALK